MMPSDLTAELLTEFKGLIYRQSSLSFSPARVINLEMHIRERVKNLELRFFEDYLRLLQEDTEEFEKLIERITTKETYFFRISAQFEALGQSIIPDIEERLSRELQLKISELQKGKLKAPLRIWSAGCASGEEPYSVAMTVLESLRYPRAWGIEILATDISREVLDIARRGYYESAMLNRIPTRYLRKFVAMHNGGGFISDELKKMISFRIFNLRDITREDSGPGVLTIREGTGDEIDMNEYFDIIFCRNVMIYFDFPAQQGLVDNLYRCLKPGGYLFTGDAELLHIYKHRFKSVEKQGAFFYQKPAT